MPLGAGRKRRCQSAGEGAIEPSQKERGAREPMRSCRGGVAEEQSGTSSCSGRYTGSIDPLRVVLGQPSELIAGLGDGAWVCTIWKRIGEVSGASDGSKF